MSRAGSTRVFSGTISCLGSGGSTWLAYILGLLSSPGPNSSPLQLDQNTSDDAPGTGRPLFRPPSALFRNLPTPAPMPRLGLLPDRVALLVLVHRPAENFRLEKQWGARPAGQAHVEPHE